MSEFHPGDKLDHYRIEGLVARSGMASIFRATDERDGKAVAIKLPHPEMEADRFYLTASSAKKILAENKTAPAWFASFPTRIAAAATWFWSGWTDACCARS